MCYLLWKLDLKWLYNNFENIVSRLSGCDWIITFRLVLYPKVSWSLGESPKFLPDNLTSVQSRFKTIKLAVSVMLSSSRRWIGVISTSDVETLRWIPWQSRLSELSHGIAHSSLVVQDVRLVKTYIFPGKTWQISSSNSREPLSYFPSDYASKYGRGNQKVHSKRDLTPPAKEGL